jgi:hypothetical protein
MRMVVPLSNVSSPFDGLKGLRYISAEDNPKDTLRR